MKTRRSVRGFRVVRTLAGFTEYRYERNGLTVLHCCDDTAPVAGLMVTYLVGSRDEAVGYTGATHLLEHLMFKGSRRFPPRRGVSVLDAFSEKGALVNASTWFDRTNYYEVMPDEHLAFAMELEADRMRHALITEKDRANEMPAVLSEYAMRVENDPQEYLDEHVWANAFMAHPYHHPTIGWHDDFTNVSTERLLHFYNTYYWPNNAVVSVVGNVEAEQALTLVAKHFGVHPRSPHPIPSVYTSEPPQQGKRFVEVSRAGTKQVVCVAYKVPAALHDDTPALEALEHILVGGTTSRLYRALVETRHCVDVHSTYMPLRDPSLLPLVATLSEGVKHEAVEGVIRKECARVVAEGVSVEELARVRAQLQVAAACARDGHYATLSVLNEAIAVGDWRFFFSLPALIARLTPEDIRRVAARYLVDTGITVGYYRARSPTP